LALKSAWDDDGQSHIDSNDYSEGIKVALAVKGLRNAPSELDVSTIKMIVDSVQAGFGIKQGRHIQITGTFDVVNNKLFHIFDPTDTFAGAFNNREVEVRLLAAEVTVSGVADTPGDTITCDFVTQIVGEPATPGVFTFCSFEKTQEAGVSFYSWRFPNEVLDPGGAFQSYNLNWWNGMILPNQTFDVVIKKPNAFVGTEIFNWNMVFYTVPRRAHLPL